MVIPNAKVFFWITDAAAVNPNCIKTFLTNVLSTFFIKGNQISVMVLKISLKIVLIVLLYAIECLMIL